MADLILRGIKGSPLSIDELDTNFININNDIGTKLNASAYTSTDVLAKVLSLDGPGSGLDADTVDGYNTSTSTVANTVAIRNASGDLYATAFRGDSYGVHNGNVVGGIISGAVSASTVSATLGFTGDLTGDVTGAITTSALTLTGPVTANSFAGSAGQVLASRGSSLSPEWVTIDASNTNNTWTGSQTFRDNKFAITDDSDTTKILNLQLSSITTGTTRTLTVADSDGTIATREYIATGAISIGNLITAGEKTTVSATTAAGTIQYDILSQSILYYTSAATSNWTLNIRGNSSTTLNSVMAIGETRTITFLATQGGNAYHQASLTIDNSSVIPRWQNGVTVTSGNTNGIDVYVLAIVKTANATFTVLESSTKFA